MATTLLNPCHGLSDLIFPPSLWRLWHFFLRSFFKNSSGRPASGGSKNIKQWFGEAFIPPPTTIFPCYTSCIAFLENVGLRGAPRGPVSIAACVPSSFVHLLLPSTGLILGHDEWKNNKSRKGGGDDGITLCAF